MIVHPTDQIGVIVIFISDHPWLIFLMIVLASYRFTHLIVFDKIMEFVRNPFMKEETTIDEGGRSKMKKVPANNFGYLLNCYWCAGIWSSVLFGIGYLWFPTIAFPAIFIFAIAGAQSIIETFVGVGTKAIHALDKYGDNIEK
ncbi:DUF1360 domain-containing protein [Salipaludibacillus sp. HK11]|uniref:DUF1360 domain-containing protein n=1 Tax=Salipaludibacillus sp. HK11 TaxID=3394320 RepID=UPI0039FD1A60